MIRALLAAAALVLVAALVVGAPALGDPGDAVAAQSTGGDLRSEYPLRDPKQCCSSSPAPAAAVDQPRPDGPVDGDGGLTLWVLAIALASCLALVWFVRSRPDAIPRVDLSRAAAVAGAVPRAVRGIDVGGRVTAVARAVPGAVRRIDLKAVIPIRDRSHRGGATTPEPEPSGIMEDRDPMDDEPPTTARKDPPPERRVAAPGDGPAVPPPRVLLVSPRTFTEVGAIRDGFNAATAVVLDLRSTEPELAEGLTYFASGFTFGLGGALRELADDIYLLTPRNVDISAEETTRLLESLPPRRA